MPKYLHRCTFSPNHVNEVEINFETNWAVSTTIPGHSFPIYKPCCSFQKIDEDGTVSDERQYFPNNYPVLIIKDELDGQSIT